MTNLGRYECSLPPSSSEHIDAEEEITALVVSVGTVRDRDDLPPLYEPLLVPMSPAVFSRAGFERVDGADYAQSWLVSALSVLNHCVHER